MSVTVNDNLVPTKCNRCGGQWMHEHDSHGEYLSCLSCGNQFDLTIESGVWSDRATEVHDIGYHTSSQMEYERFYTGVANRGLALGKEVR